MYNVKVLKYPSGVTRVTVYEYFVKEDFKVERPKMWSPFENELMPAKTFLDPLVDSSDMEKKERSLYESLRRTKSKVYDYSLSNDWDWFVTLTFDGAKVDRYDYDACVSAMKVFLDRARRKSQEMRYLIVPEKHKDGAFHFHGLLARCDGLKMADSGVRQGGHKVYNISGFKYGFSTATRIKDSRASGTYLSKYITKELCQVSPGRKRYWNSRNLTLPEKQVFGVDFEGGREKLLDGLFDGCRYYNRSVSLDGDRVSYFFEYDGDLPVTYFENCRQLDVGGCADGVID